MSEYERLSDDARRDGPVRDLSHIWNKCQPVSGESAVSLERFCRAKQLTVESLQALQTRIRYVGKGPDMMLAWPAYGRVNGVRTVTGVKYRHPETGKRHAEAYTTFGIPMVIGDPSSEWWLIAEGETDAARLWTLVGDVAAILVLPAGALTFRPAWARMVPRGAFVFAALDADEAGERGARNIIRMLGGKTVRLMPDKGAKDWCDWPGDRSDLARLMRSANENVSRDVLSMQEVLDRYMEERSGDRPKIKTGFATIDTVTKGISDGQVFTIAARTAVGKTWCMNSITDNLAKGGLGTLILSLEMPAIEWVERQFAISEGVPPEEVEQWALSGTMQQQSRAFIEKMKHTFIYERSLKLEDIASAITKARVRLGGQPLRAILVDYLGLLHAKGDAYERTSLIARGLKEIAKDEQLAVVVAMQLSRSGGDGTIPVALEMLRDSGVVEEASDFILGLWKESESGEVVKAKVLKNRKGTAGKVVSLHFNETSRRLYEPAMV